MHIFNARSCTINNISTNGYGGESPLALAANAFSNVLFKCKKKKRIKPAHPPTIGGFARVMMSDSR